ncbi:fibroblast growth factor receptor 2-like [Saccoglossus kowalevskii]
MKDQRMTGEHVYASLTKTQSAENIYTNLHEKVWEFPRENIVINEIIAKGSYGNIAKSEAWNIADTRGSTTVVVNIFEENPIEDERITLLNDVDMMKSLGSHPNVVDLLGYCTIDDPILLIFEYMPNGNLQKRLQNSRELETSSYVNLTTRRNTLTNYDLLSFSYQCAMGMEFLEWKKYMHSELAARNILMNNRMICKLSRIGLARDVGDKNRNDTITQKHLYAKWMSPETLLENVHTIRSNVWSFGILLWEIFTLGCEPYPNISVPELIESLGKGHRMPKPGQCDTQLCVLIKEDV